MEVLTDEQLLNEIYEGAELFIRSSSDDETIQETYEFSFEELQTFLLCFGGGLVKQLNEQNKTLKWSANWIQNSAQGNGNPDVIAFADNMAMTIKSLIK